MKTRKMEDGRWKIEGRGRADLQVRHHQSFQLPTQSFAVAWIFLATSFGAQAQSNVYAIGNLAVAKLAEMDAAINEAIAEKRCPGGVLWVEHNGSGYHKAFGRRALVPDEETMTEDTIFDAASLTKVVACAPALMLLVERGKVGLDDKVAKYIPEFAGVRVLRTPESPLSDTVPAVREPTIHDLFRHTAGLIARR